MDEWTFRQLVCEDDRGMGYIEDDQGRDIAHVGHASLWKADNLRIAALMTLAPETAAERDALKAEVERLRAALEWYSEKAIALAGDWHAKPQYAEAIFTELSLDGGKRARAALERRP